MKFRNRKASVVAVLALLLVIQIVFGVVANDHTSAVGNLAENSTSAQEESIGGIAMLPHESATAQADVNAPTEHATMLPIGVDFTVGEEIIQANLHVVYHSTVKDKEAVDVFDSEADAIFTGEKIVSYTNTQCYIRQEPKFDGAVMGIMYSGSEGDVIEVGETWTKIRSGSVEGYVYNSDILFGEEAQVIAAMIGTVTAAAREDGVNVYSEANEESELLGTLQAGEDLDIVEYCGAYYLVTCRFGNGYIARNQVEVSYGLRHAKTIEEIRREEAEAAAAAAAAAAAEAARRAEEAKKQAESMEPIPTVFRAPYHCSDEEIHLLAAIVYWEAGWEPIAGQIAVANVVLNRVYSPQFSANTITKVVYSPGQFTGVANNWQPTERFQAILNMSNEELNKRGCYDSALRALNGENNIDDYLFFISVKKANFAKYEKYYILNNHCFYYYHY